MVHAYICRQNIHTHAGGGALNLGAGDVAQLTGCLGKGLGALGFLYQHHVEWASWLPASGLCLGPEGPFLPQRLQPLHLEAGLIQSGHLQDPSPK